MGSLGWVVAALAALLLVGGLVIWFLIGPFASWLARREIEAMGDEKDRARVIKETRETVLKAAGGAAVIAGALGAVGTFVTTLDSLSATRRQIDAIHDGQLNERYARAVEQLGARDSVNVRLGGIYALERLAIDSERDRPAILEVLAGFIRDRARSSDRAQPPSDKRPGFAGRPPEVHAALAVLDRLRRGFRVQTKLDLSGISLVGASLPEANINNMRLTGADLTCADLSRASLPDSDLSNVELTNADLRNADVTNADLRGANLTGVDLSAAKLAGTTMLGARLHSADLRGADLRHVRGLTRRQLTDAQINSKTLLPSGI